MSRPAWKLQSWGVWVAATAILVGLGIAVLLWTSQGDERRAGLAPPIAAQGHDMASLLAGLQRQLDANPNDGEGWLMLGRSYLALGQPQQAVYPLSHAYRLLGEQPAVLLAYAQALAAIREPDSFSGRPAELIANALAAAPENPQALWLAGVAAAQAGHYAAAARHWQALLALQPPAADAALIRRNLAAVQARLDGDKAGAPLPALQQPAPGLAAPTTTRAALPASAPADATRTQGEAASVDEGERLAVRVSLAADLADRASPDATVFIFARAVSGPPMPLAVVKTRVAELPLTVTLDDGDSMMPGRGLSSANQVTVVARVSQSGNALAQPGDLQSKSVMVSLDDTEALALTVDEVVGQTSK